MNTLLQYGLAAVFLALLLAPFGLPIPEDISLLVAGALAATGLATYAEALIVGYLGVIIGDIFSWSIGRHVGLEPQGWLSRIAGRAQIERIERFYRRYGSWAIVICRQIPGMRFPAFFFAGATGVSLPRFLAFDGTAAIITANLYVYLGYTFAGNLEEITPYLNRFRLIAVLVAVGLFIGLAAKVYQMRQRRAKRVEELNQKPE